MGHTVIGFCHDPDHRYLENFSVMGDPAVDLRDPVFFRWHAFIDDMFTEYKSTIPRYTVQQVNIINVITFVEWNRMGFDRTFLAYI